MKQNNIKPKDLGYIIPAILFVIFIFIASALIPFIFIKDLPITYLGWAGIIICCSISIILNMTIIMYLLFMCCLSIEDRVMSEIVTDLFKRNVEQEISKKI